MFAQLEDRICEKEANDNQRQLKSQTKAQQIVGNGSTETSISVGSKATIFYDTAKNCCPGALYEGNVITQKSSPITRR